MNSILLLAVLSLSIPGYCEQENYPGLDDVVVEPAHPISLTVEDVAIPIHVEDVAIPIQVEDLSPAIEPLVRDVCPPARNCHRLHRHHCVNPPQCGPCFSSHFETPAGLCVPHSRVMEEKVQLEQLEDNFIDGIETRHRVRKEQEGQNDNAAEGQNVVPEVNAQAQDANNNINKGDEAKDDEPKSKDDKKAAEEAPKAAGQARGKSNSQAGANNAAGNFSNIYLIATIAGCSVAGLVGLMVAGMCYYRIQKSAKAASEVDYPAYGVTGPNKERTVSPPGDRKLAQSAQMYHYQHQKQQMIALEKANSEMKHDASDEDSDEENEEGDYTVYECPGLAPTGDMEVKNPLFNEDPAPAPPSGDERMEK